ncbi:MAG: GNAT family N-acetyltransferase [Deltaproteobacteria bacterium]|nr:GNAT family N-acetyltransferase [Deltaproteobacteria bacterium]MBM4390840.1 GNAT family N-acetyltransferase [Deltaproteobacteria bacterium]
MTGLTLRATVEADRPEWIRGLRASRELHAPWFPSLDDRGGYEGLFESGMERQAAGTAWRGLAIAPDGRVAAWVNLNDIVRGVSETANAGWSVNAEFAGRGVATWAVGALLTHAFSPEGLGLHRVACGIMPANHRSLRVAEKCGFRREGFARELIRIAGNWEDHVLLAKLASEHGG